MNKSFKIFTIACCFTLLSTSLFAQERFNYLRFRAADLYFGYRQTGFDRFIFIFKQLQNGRYILEGSACDIGNNQIANKFSLETVGVHFVNLKNNLPGFIFLTKEMIDRNQVNTNQHLYFSPRKYRNENGNEEDYVSYDVSSVPPPSLTADFVLNPSPPAPAPTSESIKNISRFNKNTPKKKPTNSKKKPTNSNKK